MITRTTLLRLGTDYQIQRFPLDFKREYSFFVGRYTLTPDKGDHIIHIYNFLFDDQVCAIKACIDRDKLGSLFEQEQSKEDKLKLLTVTPVLSKIMYYLYKKEHHLFTALTLSDTNYRFDKLTVFNLEYAYDGEGCAIDYHNIYQYLTDERK